MQLAEPRQNTATIVKHIANGTFARVGAISEGGISVAVEALDLGCLREIEGKTHGLGTFQISN